VREAGGGAVQIGLAVFITRTSHYESFLMTVMSGVGYNDNAPDQQVQIGLSVFAVRGVATLLGAAAGGVALDHWRGLPRTFESRSATRPCTCMFYY
jgi:hypothetical protein